MIDSSQARDSSSREEPANCINQDQLRLIAIWSWLGARPHATLQEFLDAVQRIDALFARESQ